MKHLLLIIFLLVPFLGNSQSTHKIDSLKKVLAGLPVAGKSFSGDTLRVRVLYDISREFTNDADSIIIYSDKSVNLSKKIKYSNYEIRNLIEQARAYRYKGFYYNAIDKLIGVKLLAEKKKNDFEVGKIDLSIADNYLWSSEYSSAQKHYILAMRIFKKLKAYEEYADTQNNLAINYINQKDYNKAILLLNDCFKYLPYIKGELSEISFYDNLSLAYSGLNKHYYAIKNSERAILMYKQLSKSRDVNLELSRSYLILGSNYLKNNQVKQAFHAAKKA
jgi:tetratricopeptide (TPR) repeat protein